MVGGEREKGRVGREGRAWGREGGGWEALRVRWSCCKEALLVGQWHASLLMRLLGCGSCGCGGFAAMGREVVIRGLCPLPYWL